MRIRPLQSMPIYRPGWGGSLAGLGQCDPSSDPFCTETPTTVVTPSQGTSYCLNNPLDPACAGPGATSGGGGLTAAQLAAIIQAGTQSTIGITRALSTPSLTPGTNVIFNPATGQFYNPQTGQVVDPYGTTGKTSAQIAAQAALAASSISPGLIFGLVVVGFALFMASRR